MVALAAAGLLVITSPGGDAAAAAPTGCYTRAGISGYATNADGTPLVGAPVMVHAEPSREAKQGTRYTDPLLGWDRTDNNGCYHVPLTASKGLTGAADRYGLVNLRVTLQRSDRLEVVSYSKVLTNDGTRARLGEVNGGVRARAFRAARVARDSAVAGAIPQSFGPQARSARAAALRSATGTPATGKVAGYQGAMTPTTATTDAGQEPDVGLLREPTNEPLLRSGATVAKVFHKHEVLVGQWWSKMRGVREDWHYAQGATSQLQSALKTYSAGGGYEKSKTYAKTTDDAVDFPTAHGKTGVFYRTYFRNAKYTLWYCDASIGCQSWASRVRVYSWERGTDLVKPIPYPTIHRGNCSRYESDSGDTSRGSTAVTWTNGITIGGDLRKELGGTISLSSQTGFTTSAENRVHFNRRGFLCGVFDSLAGTPGALVAQPHHP